MKIRLCWQPFRSIQKWQFKKSDYPLKELSLRFLDDFDYYLKTEKKHKTNHYQQNHSKT
jgi:hypothetical protein